MYPIFRAPYAFAVHLAKAATFVAPGGGGKVLASLRARRGIGARYAAWGATGRDARRPLLWVHAASVGEGLMARPVLALVRRHRPDLQVAYTFFSPSAEPFARRVGADFSDYLPFDTAADARRSIAALRPSAIVFSKLDVWPVLAEQAASAGVRLGLISATMAARAGRATRTAPLLLGDAYRTLDAVGAIDARDAGRLAALGVHRERISITGDTRYDQVWERVRSVDRASPLLAPLASPRPTLVAGSTWPADEAPLLDAWRSIRQRLPSARLVIAPHEPTAAHLEPIERWASASGLQLARLGADAQGVADVVLVDRMGVLADLYALAGVAYVGGGFHATGLHSLIEPAAFGVPVLFGPRHGASRDAGLLIDAGGGFAVSSTRELSMRLLALFSDTNARAASGGRARALVESELGAAERSAALVERLLATS